MTKKTLEKMPSAVVSNIERLRAEYRKSGSREDLARLAGYVDGLRDAGLATERERVALFIYGTI